MSDVASYVPKGTAQCPVRAAVLLLARWCGRLATTARGWHADPPLSTHLSPGRTVQELAEQKEKATDDEALFRKKKNKVRFELNAIVSRYDQEMGKRQEEIEDISKM